MNPRCIVLSLGMGVDSLALLLRWIRRPSSRNFKLSDLILVTAMTGEENPATIEQMERLILPLIRRHRIRYVQICRAGQKKKHGYVVLDDSRAARRMHPKGPWRLSYEMRTGGTVPSVIKGRRWCSERAKGDPIDWWVTDNCPPGYTHVVGYAAEEERRATGDRQAREEKERAGRTVPSRPEYPLINWGWNRLRCDLYLWMIFGERISRSCCTFCPFQATAGNKEELAARWRANPEAGASALLLERTALSLNPRMGLFGTNKTAAQLCQEKGLTEVQAIADERQAAIMQWDLLEIRRIFPALKARVLRSTRRVATADQTAIRARLTEIEGAEVITDACGISRAWLRRLPEDRNTMVYPAIEWFYVLVPHGVEDKERTKFAETWREAINPGATEPAHELELAFAAG